MLSPSCECLQKTHATSKFVTKSLEFKVFASKTPWPSFSSAWCHIYMSPVIALNWPQLFLIEAIQASKRQAARLLCPFFPSSRGAFFNKGTSLWTWSVGSSWVFSQQVCSDLVQPRRGVVHPYVGSTHTHVHTHTHGRPRKAFFLIIDVWILPRLVCWITKHKPFDMFLSGEKKQNSPVQDKQSVGNIKPHLFLDGEGIAWGWVV